MHRLRQFLEHQNEGVYGFPAYYLPFRDETPNMAGLIIKPGDLIEYLVQFLKCFKYYTNFIIVMQPLMKVCPVDDLAIYCTVTTAACLFKVIWPTCQ